MAGAAVRGLCVGALLLGGVVSLLHVRLNPDLGVVPSLTTWLFFALFYGVVVGASCGAAALVLGVLPPLRSLRERLPFLSLACVLLVFFEAVALYGLTYDQTMWLSPETVVGMTAYLVAAGLLVAVVVLAASWLADAVIGRLVASGSAAQSLAIALVLGVVLHVALAAIPRPEPAGVGPTVSETEVDIVETGVDVVLIGLDGTDPRVVDRLISEGLLPEWAARRAAGASGPLATLPGANSAVIWASIYSGYDRWAHGVLDFYRVKIPGTGPGVFPVHRTWFKELLRPLGLLGLEVVSRADLQRLPLWEITDHFGLETGVVDGYFYSYPALPPITPGGYFLSYGLDTYLAGAEPGALDDLPFYLQPIDLFEGEPLPRGEDLEWQTDATLRLLAARPQPRFLNFYTHQPDAIQHEEWAGWEPERFFPWQRRPTAAPIVDKHLAFDRLLADLEAAVGDDTVFLLVSDHGHSATPIHKLSSQHRHGPPGVLLAWGGPIRSGIAVEGAHVFDVMPTVLHLLGMPVPADVPGRVLTELFDADFNELHPVRTVPRYEGMWKARALEASRGRELNEEEIEKLRAMGYL